VAGDMIVKRVPGNFHLSAHAHAHLLNLYFEEEPMNLTHYIHALSFGSHPEEVFDMDEATINPLGRTRKIVTEQKDNEPKSYEYYIKIVPMLYDRFGDRFDSFQYVSNSNEIDGRYAIPGKEHSPLSSTGILAVADLLRLLLYGLVWYGAVCSDLFPL
jgi:hypothetical protein